MAYITKSIYGLVEQAFQEFKDPRVEHLPLLQSPLLVLSIIAAYLMFVLNYGPKWMEKRTPYNLKHIMRIYNAIQVMVNAYLFIFGLQNSYLRREFSWTCQPLQPHNTEPWMHKLLMISYGYYLTKYLDLFDTFFFVLRKKNHQITFLHVYHHAGMIFATYIFMKFLPGSHSTMLGIINLFVHVVMYSYYFITSLGPIKESRWWKRHITQLQLLQFGYLIVHFVMALINNWCHHPVIIAMVGVIQNLFMFVLFFDFYRKTYINKPTATKLVGAADSGAGSGRRNGEGPGSGPNNKDE